jgi:ATP-dependent DNA helicase RecG
MRSKGDVEWLEQVLVEGESETVEFKQSLDGEALDTVGAFANAKGGTLLVGVADDGVMKGLTFGKEIMRDWANRIVQAAHVHPQIKRISYRGKNIVAIQVSESAVKPVPCRGRYLIRVGRSNRQMTDDDLTRAVLGRLAMTWDEIVEPRSTLKDLDSDQIKRFRTDCNQQGRRSIPPNEDDYTVLEKLGLVREGQLLRAAILLFGKEPQRFYPSAFVKIGRFRSPTLIVDDREIYGTLFDQVENTIFYFREHLETRFEFEGEPARKVIWEYPLEALRGAVINAICHRDYLGTPHIQIRWYDDQVVLFNSGGLPPPLRLEDLKQSHPSIPRNRKIAEIFFYVGWIESWGGGIQKILDECASAGMPEPKFEERIGGLWLTFLKDILTEENLRSLGLNERQIKAVFYVKEKRRITNAEYQNLSQVSMRTATRELGELGRKGILEQAGKTGRGTFYVLKAPETRQTRQKDAINTPNTSK